MNNIEGPLARIQSELTISGPHVRIVAVEAADVRALISELEQWRELAQSYKGDAIDTLAKLREAVDVMRGVRGCYVHDGDGKPPTFGRPMIHDAWKRFDAFLATVEKQDG